MMLMMMIDGDDSDNDDNASGENEGLVEVMMVLIMMVLMMIMLVDSVWRWYGSGSVAMVWWRCGIRAEVAYPEVPEDRVLLSVQ